MGCDCRIFGKVKMETIIVKVDEFNIDAETISKAGEIIQRGGLVAFPTETVYGLGGDGFNSESSKKIYAAKGRPSDNPLIVHIADIEDLKALSPDIPKAAYKLADAFWPGPLTMILKKVENLPKETTGGLDTVAVRMPVHPVALEFIKAAGGFVAAPSANKSGRPSPTLAKYVIEDLDGRVDMIIDGGDSDIGLESTIVDLTGDIPMILRPGYITPKDIEEVLGQVDVDRTIIDSNSKVAPKAPGMKYRHYAPKADMTIVEGENQEVIRYINEHLEEARREGLKSGVIATLENRDAFAGDLVKYIGSRGDEATIARNLFRILREFDDEGVQIIYTEDFRGEGIAFATMNRLLKAAGHKEVKV